VFWRIVSHLKLRPPTNKIGLEPTGEPPVVFCNTSLREFDIVRDAIPTGVRFTTICTIQRYNF
jgi:hypothetical protein